MVPALLLSFFASAAWLLADAKSNVPGLFIFGDSLVDSGTNNYIQNSSFKANFAPYGITFFGEPTGRFSDGRHVADFIAEYLELPLPHPVLGRDRNFDKGANFASAGSGILDSTNKGRGRISLSKQIRQFVRVTRKLQQKYGFGKTNKLISESIYMILSGSNDILGNYLINPDFMRTITPEQFIGMMVEGYASSVKTLYRHGARKIVVFGLGPLGCIPVVRAAANSTNGTCVSAPNELAVGFNSALQNAVAALRSSLVGSNILYANTLDKFLKLYEQTALQTASVEACCGGGLLNAQINCGFSGFNLCSMPSQFLFWDAIHLTERTYQTFAELFWAGQQPDISPINISALAAMCSA